MLFEVAFEFNGSCRFEIAALALEILVSMSAYVISHGCGVFASEFTKLAFDSFQIDIFGFRISFVVLQVSQIVYKTCQINKLND